MESACPSNAIYHQAATHYTLISANIAAHPEHHASPNDQSMPNAA